MKAFAKRLSKPKQQEEVIMESAPVVQSAEPELETIKQPLE